MSPCQGRHLFIMGDRNRAKRNDSMNKEQDKEIYSRIHTGDYVFGDFLFCILGGEYLFDNMIGYHVSSAKVVLAQGCILGSSGIGFFGYSWIERHAGVRNRGLLLITGAAFSVAGIFTVEQHVSFAVTMTAGLILFCCWAFSAAVSTIWQRSCWRTRNGWQVMWAWPTRWGSCSSSSITIW